MSIYVEEVIVAIENLHRFGTRLLGKFDSGASAKDLLPETDDLEAKIKALVNLLPEGISLGDWGRKIYFMGVWLKKNEPDSCRGDLAAFVENDLAEAAKQVRAWGGALGYLDEELRKAVAHLIRNRDFSSAIRAAFVVLTERLRQKYGLTSGIDGPALVNEVFGSKSTLTPHLEDKQRQAIRDYLSGSYGLIRNKYAHSNPPLDLVELEAALGTISLGLKLIA